MNDESESPENQRRSLSIKELAERASTMNSSISKALAEAGKQFTFGNLRPPVIEPLHFKMPDIPTPEERNSYQSASAFMKAAADAALEWKENLPVDYQPAILAILYGGIQIEVHSLAQVSFHGIRIEGLINGAPCTLLAHQSTVQILCCAQKVTPESRKNPIGFVWESTRVEV